MGQTPMSCFFPTCDSMWVAPSGKVPPSGIFLGNFSACETFQPFHYFRNTLLNYTRFCWHKGHNTLPRGILHEWNKLGEKACEMCVSAAALTSPNSTQLETEYSWHSGPDDAFRVSYIRRVLIPQIAWAQKCWYGCQPLSTSKSPLLGTHITHTFHFNIMLLFRVAKEHSTLTCSHNSTLLENSLLGTFCNKPNVKEQAWPIATRYNIQNPNLS